VPALKALASTIYDSLEERGDMEPLDGDWEPAQIFFEERKVRTTDLAGTGDWKDWKDELEGVSATYSHRGVAVARVHCFMDVRGITLPPPAPVCNYA